MPTVLTSPLLRHLSFAGLLLCFPLLQAEPSFPLWKGSIPGARQSATYVEETTLNKERQNAEGYRKVTEPRLEVFLPEAGKACGTAIVLCPGGGYGGLAYDHEGRRVARWFQGLGVAAFVLKYRLPSDEIMQDRRLGPLQDVQEALRVVRRQSADWGLDPHRLGVMGFSAGGHLAGTATTMYEERVYEPEDATSARPDFSVLVYGVLSLDPAITHRGTHDNLLGKTPAPEEVQRFSNELHVDAQTPPCFLVHAADDKVVPVENSLRFHAAMLKAGVPGELHIYEKGGHGFSFVSKEPATQRWPEALAAWLGQRGLLEKR